MTTEHTITPPPELMEQWSGAWYQAQVKPVSHVEFVATQAARWAADQELEACCDFLELEQRTDYAALLRSMRRPKPPSLKEQALKTLQKLSKDGYPCNYQDDADWDTIRRALEQLDD